MTSNGKYGSRAKIAFMLPSSCLAFEQEFIKVTGSLDGVIGIPTRMLLGHTDANGLTGMNEGIDLAARQLVTTSPDVAVYMCTAGSFKDGQDGNQAIKDRLAELVPGARVMTTSEAIVRGIKTFGMRRVVMTTPYDEDLTHREVEFLAHHGVTVTDFDFRDIDENLDRGDLPASEWLKYAGALDYSGADGFFLSCGNIQALDIVDTLEARSGLPVVTSVQATIWMALRLAGIDDRIPGFGALLREH
jgi:maleate isomerase